MQGVLALRNGIQPKKLVLKPTNTTRFTDMRLFHCAAYCFNWFNRLVGRIHMKREKKKAYQGYIVNDIQNNITIGMLQLFKIFLFSMAKWQKILHHVCHRFQILVYLALIIDARRTCGCVAWH